MERYRFEGCVGEVVKTIQKINPKKHRYSGFPPISDQRINASWVESFLKRVFKEHTIQRVYKKYIMLPDYTAGEKLFTVKSGIHKGTQFLIDANTGRAEIYRLCSKGEKEYFPNTNEWYVVYEVVYEKGVQRVQKRCFRGYHDIP